MALQIGYTRSVVANAKGNDRQYDALLAGVRAGDPRSLDDLLQRAMALARRYSQAVCGRAPDREDAVQEALIKTFRHAGRIREPRAFPAWLYRTVRNACLLGRRRGAAAPRETSLGEGDGDSRVADASPSADERLILGEQREVIRRALSALPANYREAIFLRDFEELATREVARILGISETNVKVRLHRAHNALRRQIESGSPATSSSTRGAKG
jgi:RNA polymerase sigma-70 factor (ECF subfamily)